MPTFPILVSDSNIVPQFLSPSAGSSFAGGASNSGNNGPYVIGDNRYLVGLYTDVGPSFNLTFGVMKSTDHGVTWAIQDLGNAPDANNNPGNYSVVSVLDVDGQHIWVVYINAFAANNHVMSIIQFDTATDTWGSVLDTIQLLNTATGSVVPLSQGLGAIQNSSGDITVVGNFYNFFDTDNTLDYAQAGYILYSSGWGSFAPFDSPANQPGAQPGVMNYGGALVAAGTLVHCFFRNGGSGSGFGSVPLYHQSLSGTTLGTLETIGNSEWDLNQAWNSDNFPFYAVYDSSTGRVSVVVTGLGSNGSGGIGAGNYTLLFTDSKPNASSLGLSLSSFDPGLAAGRVIASVTLVLISPGIIYTFYATSDAFNSGQYLNPFMSFLVNYATPTDLGVFGLDATGTSLGGSPSVSSLNGYAIAFTGSQFYWEQFGIVPPAPTPTIRNNVVGGGGTYFPRSLNKTLLLASIARIYGTNWALLRDIPYPPLSSFFQFPNQFDICLGREFILYDLIDRQAMSCARKPDCFLKLERDWKDYPPGWITFNPVKSIPLPAPGDGDVVLLSFRVPYGYDGVITAQYNSYTENFTEGSGDIEWRIRADGRYLRDCGDILFTMGSPKQLSPIYGGLQLRSGNLVEYVVSAPNTSGLLPPPGTGNILAGLHGLFYPRT